MPTRIFRDYLFTDTAAYTAALAAEGWSSGLPAGVSLVDVAPPVIGNRRIAASFVDRDPPASWAAQLQGTATLGQDQYDEGVSQSYVNRAAFLSAAAGGRIPAKAMTVLVGYDAATDTEASRWRRVQSQPNHPEFVVDGATWWELWVADVSPAMLGPASADMSGLVMRAQVYAARTGNRFHDATRTFPCQFPVKPVIAGYTLRHGRMALNFSTMPNENEDARSGSSTLMTFAGNPPVLIGNLLSDIVWPGGNSTTVSPANAALLAAGDLVVVEAAGFNITGAIGAGYTATAAFCSRIASVNTGTGAITFHDMVDMSRFTVANGARIWKLDRFTTIEADEILITGTGAVDGLGNERMQRGFSATFCYNNRFRYVRTVDCQRGVAGEPYSVGAHYEFIDFYGITNSQEGYVLSHGSTFGLTFGTMRTRRARHAINNAVNGGEPTRPWASGPLMGGHIIGIEAVGGLVDTHPGCSRLVLDSLVVSMAADADVASGDCVYCQGAGLSINLVHISNAISRGARFASSGWFPYDGYVPEMYIGHLHVDRCSGAMVEIRNETNQDASGSGQLIRAHIGRLTGRSTSNAAVKTSALQGPVQISVGSMRVTANTHAVEVETDAGFSAEILVNDFEITQLGPSQYPFLLNSEQGRITARNGRISANASNRVAAAQGGIIRLENVDLSALGTPVYFKGTATGPLNTGVVGQVLGATTPWAALV
jgi:hypothetical protein